MSRRRVVITGMGAVSPVGLDLPSTWKALLAGQSGAGPVTKFDVSRHSTKFSCEVKGFEINSGKESGWSATRSIRFDGQRFDRDDRFDRFFPRAAPHTEGSRSRNF